MSANDVDSGVLVAMGLDRGVARFIEQRKPFKTHWLIGYCTRGGSYALASSGDQTDSGKPHDLIVVLPGDLGQGVALPVNIAVNPRLVEVVTQIVSTR